MNEALNKIAELKQLIRNLKAKLSSTDSSVGDWKIAKCVEYQTVGLESPYNIEELYFARQKIRDEINSIQDEITVIQESIKKE